MKLDPQLLRDIMIACEEADDGTDNDIDLAVPGSDPRVVSYHVRRLGQAGYLEVDTLPDTDDLDFTWHVPKSVTFAGHQFIAATRDDSTWKKVLKSVGAKAGSVTIDTILAIAVAEGKRRLGLPE